MKFTCDGCGAQYMISDDKVGPNGVKVRCKKCQHVVLVRRPAEPAPAAAPPASAPEGGGLDAELGHAFDSMLGGGPSPAAGASPGAAPSPDLQSTQVMSEEDAARIAAAPAGGGAGPAAASDWYVAIGESQVGPLPLPEVRRKWESGEVGPDSLVWKPGMADWQPLSTVADLAAALAPVPRAAARSRPDPAREPARAAGPGLAAPAEEPAWKPSGASALASLASEELAARAPEARPAARPAGGGARSLVEQMNLPDAGGVDPTGAIPLAIKGLEPTPDAPRRKTSVARGAAQVRQRRSALRRVAAALVLLVVAGGGAAAFAFKDRLFGGPRGETAETAAAPAEAPPPAAPPPAPKAAPPAPPAAVAAAPTPAPAAAAPAPKAPEPARAEPRPAPKAAPTKLAAAEPSRTATRTERRAEAPPPAPAPAASPKKKADPLLDFDSSGDSALDEALGGTPSGRSVYVPPRPGSDLPAQLSASQINESVLGQVDALRRCVSEQKARDPDATGTLKMRWLILGDGAVRDVKCLSPEYASGPFASCIAGVVRSIRFPRSATKGQEVTFPFTF
jgi:predicted Zn finger-like uncharacterized protein